MTNSSWTMSGSKSARRAVTGALGLLMVASLQGVFAQVAGGRVYVSSEKDNKVYVLDTQGQRIAAIDVCQRPRHMMFTNKGSQILVCCGDSDQLGVIDTATSKMIDKVAVDESPEIFDLSADGKVAYVSIEEDSVMAAYNLETKTKLFEVKTGGEPEGVLVTPDGKRAYVTSETANLVHVIDLTTKKIIKNIRVGNRPRRFVLVNDGKEIWVSNELGASVSIVSTENHAVLQTIDLKIKGMRANDITPVGMAVSPDKKSIWVGLGGPTMWQSLM